MHLGTVSYQGDTAIFHFIMVMAVSQVITNAGYKHFDGYFLNHMHAH